MGSFCLPFYHLKCGLFRIRVKWRYKLFRIGYFDICPIFCRLRELQRNQRILRCERAGSAAGTSNLLDVACSPANLYTKIGKSHELEVSKGVKCRVLVYICQLLSPLHTYSLYHRNQSVFLCSERSVCRSQMPAARSFILGRCMCAESHSPHWIHHIAERTKITYPKQLGAPLYPSVEKSTFQVVKR